MTPANFAGCVRPTPALANQTLGEYNAFVKQNVWPKAFALEPPRDYS
jgi:hypothetical protein